MDRLTTNEGVRKKAVFRVDRLRYFVLPSPVDRIFSIKAFCGGIKLVLPSPHLTNLFRPYRAGVANFASTATVTLPALPTYPYLAVAVEGKTGNEGVVCVAEVDGKLHAFPRRAPEYPANVYECYVHPVDAYYTFYLPLPRDWQGKSVKITLLFQNKPVPADVYLCDANGKRQGLTLAHKEKL